MTVPAVRPVPLPAPAVAPARTPPVLKFTPPDRSPPPPRKPMIVVIHDPATGRILETRSGSPKQIAACGLAYVEVAEHRHDYDVTHQVVNGALVARDPAVIAAERRAAAVKRLRVRRDALLRDTVDVFGPVRWAALSAADQAKLIAYRQALLDLPAKTADPSNPDWPVLSLEKGA